MAKTSPDPLWKLLFLIQALLPPSHQECNSFTYSQCISNHVQCLRASDICSFCDHAYNNIHSGRCHCQRNSHNNQDYFYLTLVLICMNLYNQSIIQQSNSCPSQSLNCSHQLPNWLTQKFDYCNENMLFILFNYIMCMQNSLIYRNVNA
jgi:hypothetical protein